MPWILKKAQNQSIPLILRLLNEPVFFLITLHPGSSLIVSYKPVIKLFLKWIPFSVYEIILSWRQSESQEGIGSEVAAFPTTPDAVSKMDLSIYYHAGVVMLHKGSYSFFFPCEGPLPGWYGGRIQRNHRFRGMGSQREQRSFWHTTFLESLVCYTFVPKAKAGDILYRTYLPWSVHVLPPAFLLRTAACFMAVWEAKGPDEWVWSWSSGRFS